MLIKIGNFDITECWDGVFYKKLSRYPEITPWEIQTVLDFVHYEAANGRTCEIKADERILQTISEYKQIYESGKRLPPPEKITECTACPNYKGCLTDFVCHTSSPENAKAILRCGSLLSPVLARGKTAKELAMEARNAANDPEDYFHYVMFAWGNCQAGDRLVMERKLSRFPDERDLSTGFEPGVRFFFRYNDLLRHPGATFEGVLPLKVKDEVVLRDWVYAILIPAHLRSELEPYVPADLQSRVFYPEYDCRDIWEWSEKVYEFVRGIRLYNNDGRINQWI